VGDGGTHAVQQAAGFILAQMAEITGYSAHLEGPAKEHGMERPAWPCGFPATQLLCFDEGRTLPIKSAS
jgi:hypothetical protein